MTIVERAARALADNHLLVSDGHYQAAARAVLQAIREPTHEVLRAGNITVPAQDESTPCYEYDLGEDDANRVWQAMIDAALTEGVGE
jgi:hypothetical protein